MHPSMAFLYEHKGPFLFGQTLCTDAGAVCEHDMFFSFRVAVHLNDGNHWKNPKMLFHPEADLNNHSDT